MTGRTDGGGLDRIRTLAVGEKTTSGSGHVHAEGVSVDARQSFEHWATSPPYELSVERFAEHEAWPGHYKDYKVELAWCAWQESALRPSQEEAPQTGCWLDTETDMTFREIGRRTLDGSVWVDLAVWPSFELARSVRLRLFERIFKPLPTAPQTEGGR